MKLAIREKVEAVKELPNQIRMTANLAASAILLAIVAIIISTMVAIGGRRNAS